MKKRLTPQFSLPLQLYGLPKVHKEGVPLKPIVSTIGSATYDLAKEPARILSPLTRSSETSITSSREFIERLKKTDFNTEYRISFDVVRLFTPVPLESAMKVLLTRLEQDEKLEEHTAIPIHHICHLTEIRLTSTYQVMNFSYCEVSIANSHKKQ